MVDTTPKPPRVLMKDGVWLVPPDERPGGWQTYGIAEPVDPTQEEVAGSMADVAAQMADPTTDKKSVSESYARDYARAWAKRKKDFQEISVMVELSAKNFGADARLYKYALLLIAGMWTRAAGRLSHWTGLSQIEVKAAHQRLTDAGIWSEHDGLLTVHMGEECEKIPDLGFWLNVMAGAGDVVAITVEGRIAYADGRRR